MAANDSDSPATKAARSAVFRPKAVARHEMGVEVASVAGARVAEKSPVELQLERLAGLLLLETRLRDSATEVELGLLVVNDTLPLVGAGTGLLWRVDDSGKFDQGEVFALSASPLPEAQSPFVVWATRLCRALHREKGQEAGVVQTGEVPPRLLEEQAKQPLGELLWLPLRFRRKDVGALLLWRDRPWTESEVRILQQWSGTVAHGWHALRWARPSRLRTWYSRFKMRVVVGAVAALALLLLLPVRLSVLAPAELNSSDSVVVRSPLNGVIASLLVRSSDKVTAGQPLLTLDDTELKTRLEVAQQELEVARAEYRQSSQAAAYSSDAKERLQVLRITLEKYVAEVNYLSELLARTRVVADTDAIAIVDNSDEMAGRPVQLGERLLTLVDEANLELELWVPVGDDIRLEPGAPVRFFPNVAPDRAYHGQLLTMDYRAQLSPQGALAYRARASVEIGEDGFSRIGMRGTGKLYGEQVSLFYYLFRRPISFVRRSLGL
ncbi:MAG TPA: HlyD family efflux transporter periplasmic adaptor subunit [Hyphomicrobiales bacterium]|nr:HlyD family efflux transporter periplasmic adaptor subunit [Hyphomicrobiales bacterium]